MCCEAHDKQELKKDRMMDIAQDDIPPRILCAARASERLSRANYDSKCLSILFRNRDANDV